MSTATVEELLGDILCDCYGEDEELWAFLHAFSENVPVPAEALVIYQSVQVLEFDYDGNPLRGLTAFCRAADGSRHKVGLADVRFPPDSPGAIYHQAFIYWMGP